MNIKKILSIILFILIIVFANKIYADDITSISIGIGETYTINVDDVKEKYVNDGATKVEFKGAEYEGETVQVSSGNQKVKIEGVKKGNATIILSVRYKATIYTGLIPTSSWYGDKLEIKVEVINLEKEAEKIEKSNENLETYYKTDINELLNSSGGEAASNKMLYLRSILYNDNINGNNKLWNKFIDSTTSEQRQNWYRVMSYYLRDSNPEYQTVYDLLNAQIEKDKGNKTQNEVDNKLEEAGNAQKEAYDNGESKRMKLLTRIDSTERKKETFNDIFDDIAYYTPSDEKVSTTVTNKASKVLTIITNIGMVLAILMVAIMGIKYMLGSVEEKSDYKKDMIPYLVGSCLLFGILTIVKILQQIGESINNI